MKFFSLLNRSDRLRGQPSLLSNPNQCYFPGVKRSERLFDHSSPSSAGVKNQWSYTFFSPSVTSWHQQRQLSFLQDYKNKNIILHLKECLVYFIVPLRGRTQQLAVLISSTRLERHSKAIFLLLKLLTSVSHYQYLWLVHVMAHLPRPGQKIKLL